MKKNLCLVVPLSLAVILYFCLSKNIFAQIPQPNNTMVLTTYYPAPFGAYKKMTISDSVGIGTREPKALLHLSKALANPTVFENGDVGQLNVSGTSTSSGEFAKITFNNPYSIADETVGVAAIGSTFNAAGSWLYFGTSDAYTFGVTNSALVIDPNGNVGIGTTSPQSDLDILGTYQFSTDLPVGIRFKNTFAGWTYRLGIGGYGYNAADFIIWNETNGKALVTVGFNNTVTIRDRLDVLGIISQTGAINCNLSTDTNGKIQCISDERLKDIHGYYTSGLEVVSAIQPIRFNLKGEDYVHIGFSAQNVRKVLPEATPLQEDGYFGLNSDAILAAAINAVKEQQLQIENFRADKEALKNTVKSLTDRLDALESSIGTRN